MRRPKQKVETMRLQITNAARIMLNAIRKGFRDMVAFFESLCHLTRCQVTELGRGVLLKLPRRKRIIGLGALTLAAATPFVLGCYEEFEFEALLQSCTHNNIALWTPAVATRVLCHAADPVFYPELSALYDGRYLLPMEPLQTVGGPMILALEKRGELTTLDMEPCPPKRIIYLHNKLLLCAPPVS